MNNVLKFWFPTGIVANEASMKLWFGAGPAADQQIRENFLPSILAITEVTDAMAADPEQALTATILLDQFPRNIFRGTGRMFDFDRLALDLAKRVVRLGTDRNAQLAEAYGPAARAFFYLPFEHSETMQDQEEAVRLFESLQKDYLTMPLMSGFLKYAHDHKSIIERFGRFPHRNELLGRTSTPEEDAFLAEGGETFGTKPAKKDEL